jgi:hypothetical protein
MLTATEPVNVPAAGLKVGVATCTVYVPLATALSVIPLLKARAFRAVVAVNVTGPLYTVEDEVGSLPFVV